jgi:propionate CoA-transferase
MIRNKVMSSAEAIALIPDGATIAVSGAGGGLVEPDALMQATEARFLEGGHPRGLTLVHSLGLGDRDQRGVNRFAHEGMTKRVIGGHWTWSPRMQQLAREEKIEAYSLPGGVTGQLLREIGAGRPGLFSHIGLGTYVDPRIDGGRCNKSAVDDLVEVVEIDGRELLRYKPFPVNIALLRGTYADPDGNISLDQEGANLDIYAAALAAHNSGGKVIFQVRTLVERGALPARSVRVPSAIVDAIVVVPDQMQSYVEVYDPSISGERRGLVPPVEPEVFSIRQVIARRAAEELRDEAVINYGFGIPDGIAKIVAERGDIDRYYQTIEHGTYGGSLLDGVLFGFARNPSCMLDLPTQFDFYGGGGLDIAFLGMGELDAIGNVNVSKLGGITVGPGGFIDIAQNAKTMVFCGTFETKGAKLHSGDGKLSIERHGEVRKIVNQVDHITFSGRQALVQGQQVIYVTERAVFRLTEDGLVLSEIAPGIDLQRDVLDRMDFTPKIDGPSLMAAAHFTD